MNMNCAGGSCHWNTIYIYVCVLLSGVTVSDTGGHEFESGDTGQTVGFSFECVSMIPK